MFKTRILFTAAAALATLAPAAHAGLVFSTTPTEAMPGGTGAFDVLLTDTGGTYNVDGFSFDLSVAPASGVQFTNANMNTSPYTYIFNGDSFDADNGLTLAVNNLPSKDVTAGDVTSDFTNITLNTNDVYSLGDISYTIAPGTPQGSTALTFNSAGTSLSDASGAPVASSFVNGNIAAVPEASSLALFSLGLLPLGLLAARRRATAVSRR